jgi:hypothetical protein
MSLQQLLGALRARDVGAGQGHEAADLEQMALVAGKAVQQRERIEQRFAGVTSRELEDRGLSVEQVQTEITSRMAARLVGDRAMRSVRNPNGKRRTR